jgi:hypothetical protein
MTKRQVLIKVKKCIREDNKYLYSKIESYLKSGALDLTTYADDFELPGIVMYAALQELTVQRRPHMSTSRNTAANLSHF